MGAQPGPGAQHCYHDYQELRELSWGALCAQAGAGQGDGAGQTGGTYGHTSVYGVQGGQSEVGSATGPGAGGLAMGTPRTLWGHPNSLKEAASGWLQCWACGGSPWSWTCPSASLGYPWARGARSPATDMLCWGAPAPRYEWVVGRTGTGRRVSGCGHPCVPSRHSCRRPSCSQLHSEASVVSTARSSKRSKAAPSRRPRPGHRPSPRAAGTGRSAPDTFTGPWGQGHCPVKGTQHQERTRYLPITEDAA